MFAQRPPCRAIGHDTFLGRQFGEQPKYFIALLLFDTGKGIVTGLKALAPGAIRQDHLMVVEHQMDIGQITGLNCINPRPAGQMFGRDQHFAVLEIKRALIADDQNPVVR